jgi:hypothetical protein
MIYAVLPADPLQLEEPRGVLQNAPTLSVWPALRSTVLLLASFGLVLIGTLSLLGPSNSLSDRALRRACYALDDHFVVGSCSTPFAVPGSVDLDVIAAFLLAGVMGLLSFWSMQGYWRLYARGTGDLFGRVFRG